MIDDAVKVYDARRSSRFRFSKYGPRKFVSSFFDNRELIFSLSKREIRSRFRGSVLGFAWSIILPLITLLIYTFVFTVVFQARWSIETPNKFDFALNLFIGLIVFNYFSEVISRSPSLLIENSVYIKKIVFPLEVICWVPIVAGLFNVAICTLISLIAFSVLVSTPSLSCFLLIIALLPFLLFLVGTTYLLAPLGLLFPDLRQIITPILTVFMFSSPVFYPSSALPDRFKYLVDLSPLSVTISNFRGAIGGSDFQDPSAYLLFLILMLIYAWLGFIAFTYLKRGFSDVI